jgi:HAD superfamily hydrolase (TIGR01509 family)
MKEAKAVIFDMDGVIVDSEPHHEQAFLEVMRDLGYEETHGVEFSEYIGRSDQALWADFIAKHKPVQTSEQLLAMKTRHVVDLIRREQPLFEGLTALVEKLAPRYALAVASGSERSIVEEVLRLQHLGRFFSAVVTDNEIKHGKPAPDIFLRAAELLRVPPGDCWVIEDSKPGVTAALAAGMPVIAITNTHPAKDLREATHVVATYGEIERLLLEAA